MTYEKPRSKSSGVFPCAQFLNKVTLTCPVHGWVKVAAYGHLNRKYPCPICAGEQSSSIEEQQLRDFVGGQYLGPMLSSHLPRGKPRGLGLS